MNSRAWLALASAAGFLSAGIAALPVARAAEPPALFRIGKPDGTGREFGLAAETWRQFSQKYPAPVVFTVGKSPLMDWPYIHPSNADTWAGGRAHTFTVHFDVPGTLTATQFLI